VKTNGTRYSPAFKFQVVLEALKVERKGGEVWVARACKTCPVALIEREKRCLQERPWSE